MDQRCQQNQLVLMLDLVKINASINGSRPSSCTSLLCFISLDFIVK